MINVKHKNRIRVALALMLLFLAVSYNNFAAKQDVLVLIQQAEPTTARFENIPGDYASYKLWDAQDQFLGYAIIASASGYGGKLNMLSIIDEAGLIKAVSLLENYETPLYLHKVLDAGLLKNMAGRNIQAGFAGIDGVTGATVTTEAIFSAVQKGITQIGNEQLGLNISQTNGINLVWQDFLVLFLVIFSIICSVFNFKKLRPWLLILAIFFIGFIMNYSLTYGNYVSILFGNLPVFIERPLWYLMVPSIFLVTLLLGRNFYCYWLCPFGAVQEGIYRSLNLYNFSPSAEIKAKVNKGRWPMLWLAAIIALIYNNSGIASYEPFSVFFDGSGNSSQWIIMIIVLLISMAQLRFWCRNFCPVGAILDLTARLRRKIKNFKKIKIEETDVPSNGSVCTSCSTVERNLNIQDKFYIFIVSIVNILIVMSLVQSMGLI